MRHRRPGVGDGTLGGGLKFHAREVLGSFQGRGAQDQGPPVRAGDRGKGIGHAAGAAGQQMQVLHHRAFAGRFRE